MEETFHQEIPVTEGWKKKIESKKTRTSKSSSESPNSSMYSHRVVMTHLPIWILMSVTTSSQTGAMVMFWVLPPPHPPFEGPHCLYLYTHAGHNLSIDFSFKETSRQLSGKRYCHGPKAVSLQSSVRWREWEAGESERNHTGEAGQEVTAKELQSCSLPPAPRFGSQSLTEISAI